MQALTTYFRKEKKRILTIVKQGHHPKIDEETIAEIIEKYYVEAAYIGYREGLLLAYDAILKVHKRQQGKAAHHHKTDDGLIAFSANLSQDAFTNSPAGNYARQNAAKRITKINETTRKGVKDAVSRYFTSTKDLTELSAELQNYFSPIRAEMIAATEVTDAVNGQLIQTWHNINDRYGNVIIGKEWSTANDERVCPICAPLGGLWFGDDGAEPASIENQRNDAIITGIDEPFLHPGGGDAANKYDGQQFDRPPAHPRCRCILLPAVNSSIVLTDSEIDNFLAEMARLENTFDYPDAATMRKRIAALKDERLQAHRELRVQYGKSSHQISRLFELTAQIEQAEASGNHALAAQLNREYDELNRIHDELRKYIEELEKKKNLKIIDLLRVPDDRIASKKASIVGANSRTTKRIQREVDDFLSLFDKAVFENTDDEFDIIYDCTMRSFYDPSTHAVITDASKGTTAHELSHWLEHQNPDVRKSAVAFWKRRTAGEQFQFLKDLVPRAGYAPYEKAKPDKFFDPYVGKIYRHSSATYTEIVSMGIERLYTDPAGFAKQDPDFFDFIYNITRGIPTK